jgi:hypothetical protein
MTSTNSSYTIIEDDKLYIHLSPNTLINNEIRRKNIKTNRQYREYLQRNTDKIMKYNFETVPHVLGNSIPYTFSSINDNSQPNGYETCVTKEKFLSERELFANQVRPMRSTYM